ncbi:MAG: hypothetical protein NTZ05_17945 [Chloroflexi bacterium]|nr:hypothetical protein [Chloroflexota bacterium]
MLRVTDRAKDELHDTLKTYQTEPQECLRLESDDDDDFRLMVDTEKPGDTVVVHRGLKVLLVEAELADGLDGATIDCSVSSGSTQLVISR